jgi:NAD(P)H dehydrogenase (quinone)
MLRVQRQVRRHRAEDEVTGSTQAPQIAVTGATGRLGGRVAHRLAAAGTPHKLVVRNPARAPHLAGVTVAKAEFADRDAVRRALTGIRTVLMVSAAETPDRVDRHRAFIDAAVSAGVTHLVYVSFFNAAPDATFTLARDHWATEQHLRGSGMAFTVLRDNLYLDFLPEMVGHDGVIRGPAGDGRVAAVAQDDIADAATAVLRDPDGHAGRTYSLTGPQALSLDAIAATLSAAGGRTVTYHNETLDEAYESRAPYGAPAWQVDAWVSTYTAIANGELAEVTDDIPALTGHPATSLSDLLGASADAG